MTRQKNVLRDIRAYRLSLGENQTDFWKRFGVTQSGGSRYESDRSIPLPIALLILAFSGDFLSDDQLIALGKAAQRIGEKNERK